MSLRTVVVEIAGTLVELAQFAEATVGLNQVASHGINPTTNTWDVDPNTVEAISNSLQEIGTLAALIPNSFPGGAKGVRDELFFSGAVGYEK